jgi:hypothetical protein
MYPQEDFLFTIFGIPIGIPSYRKMESIWKFSTGIFIDGTIVLSYYNFFTNSSQLSPVSLKADTSQAKVKIMNHIS